jgi:hypothetical protein
MILTSGVVTRPFDQLHPFGSRHVLEADVGPKAREFDGWAGTGL